MLLDYRCHVEGGKIGTKYWPKLKQCLKNIAAMTPQQVYDTYGYPEMAIAEALNQRAKGEHGCTACRDCMQPCRDCRQPCCTRGCLLHIPPCNI
jgi:hypothetical protein